MDIHEQNETVLSHSAARKKVNTVVNGEKGGVLLYKVYIQVAALSSALSKADPAGIGTRADVHFSSEPEPGQKGVCSGQ